MVMLRYKIAVLTPARGPSLGTAMAQTALTVLGIIVMVTFVFRRMSQTGQTEKERHRRHGRSTSKDGSVYGQADTAGQ